VASPRYVEWRPRYVEWRRPATWSGVADAPDAPCWDGVAHFL